MVRKRILALILVAGALFASGLAWAGVATPSSGNQSTGTQPSGASKTGPDAVCGSADQQAGATGPTDFVAQLDRDTLWRPEGTEVRFTIASSANAPLPIANVVVCFRWEARDVEKETLYWQASPLVQAISAQGGLAVQGGVAEFAAEVPPGLANTLLSGNYANPAEQQAYTALHTVPLADMKIVIVTPGGTSATVFTLPVGITNVAVAWVVVAVALALASIILWRLAPPKMLTPKAKLPRRVSEHFLAIISNPDGIASLSQFQVMLWTFVVAAAAVYVMVLSGDLISISDGTLQLLGIAGGTNILANINREKAPADAPPPVPGVPRWSQMLVDKYSGEVDVTRVQMLMFTLITAAFVLVQVIGSYSIPEIPDNFVVLMGISNGVYLAGRQVAAPARPADPPGKPAIKPAASGADAATGAGSVPGV